jgi:tRNA A22 N-methylase
MFDPTAQLQQLITAAKAETQRTPNLDIATGALQTAVDMLAQHKAALAAKAAALPGRLKALQEEEAALKAEIAGAGAQAK